jgi:hypothetical protein
MAGGDRTAGERRARPPLQHRRAHRYSTDVPTVEAALSLLRARRLVRWWLTADGKVVEWVPVDPAIAGWDAEDRVTGPLG